MLADLPRLSVAHLPTPVQPLPRLLRAVLGEQPGLPELWVKRDDLTGAELSGNKIRKLEFLLQEALSQGVEVVVTCGGVQSNHCRATALLCARLGLSCVLLLRTSGPAPRPSGNLLLDRLAGAEVRFITPEQYRERALLMREVAAELAEKGRRAYLIPEGGSNALGALGYARCVAELQEQMGSAPLTLCHATGSGGTFAGLVLGVALLDLPWRVVGFAVCDDRAYFVNRTIEIFKEAAERFALPAAERLCGRPPDLNALDIRDGYVGRGYGLSRPDELRLIVRACRSEGLVLDPVYTGKALFGVCSELSRDPGALGERVVFLHTGGIFGLLADEKIEELLPVLS